MKFTLEINCDNAAFDPIEGELQRIVSLVATRVANGSKSSAIYDINGNYVGCYKLCEDDSES